MYSFQGATLNGFLSSSFIKIFPIHCSITFDFNIVSLLFLKKSLKASSQLISSFGG